MSEQFDMLLLASRRFTSEVDDKRIRCVAMPLRVHELLASVDAAVEESELRKKKARQQPKQRNVLDKQQIMLAKDLLMKQKGMTEEEAHRYLQKSSMANGVNMIETAQMVLSILGKNV
ncbi:MAG: ANTAR domain-containing protein [Lachnospiraceae bacterium]